MKKEKRFPKREAFFVFKVSQEETLGERGRRGEEFYTYWQPPDSVSIFFTKIRFLTTSFLL